MCILCGAAKCSRQSVAMLPWLFLPCIFAGVFSQFLSPGYRLEITAPRSACFVVIFGTFCYYEVILPRISELRERKAVMLRLRQCMEAQKAAKWRKEATKHCANCHCIYRDQHPQANGKYECTGCGRSSKKPKLHVKDEVRGVRGCGIQNKLACWSRAACWKTLWGELLKWKFFRFVINCVSVTASWISKKWRKVDRPGDGLSAGKKSGKETEDAQEKKKEERRRRVEDKLRAKLERNRIEEEEKKDRAEINMLVAKEREAKEREAREREAREREAREREAREQEAREREAAIEKKKQEEETAAAAMKEKEQTMKETKVVRFAEDSRSKHETGERETKPPESYKRRDRNHYTVQRNTSGASSAKIKTTSVHCRDVKPSTAPSAAASAAPAAAASAAPAAAAAVKETTTTGTYPSWASVLSGKVEMTIAPSTNSTPLQQDLGATSPPTQSSAPESRQSIAPVSSDPIYCPGAARTLSPISAPHNALLTSDSRSPPPPQPPPPPLLPPYFPSTVLQSDDAFPVLTRSTSTSTSTPLSADAPPFVRQRRYVEPALGLPEDLLGSEPPAPPEFRDSLTGGLISDPVTTADGYSFDRPSISVHNDSSPVTGMQLPPAPAPAADTVDRRLWPNHVLRSQIDEFNERRSRGRVAAGSLPGPSFGGLYLDPMWKFRKGLQFSAAMEDLAAYAFMASASVGLFRDLFPREEVRRPSYRNSEFFLSNLAESEKEDDDATLALVSTVLQEEAIASSLAEAVESTAAAAAPESPPSTPAAARTTRAKVRKADEQKQSPPPAKQMKTSSYSDEDFGLRLNLDNGSSSHYGVSFQTPTQFAGLPTEFYHHFDDRQQEDDEAEKAAVAGRDQALDHHQLHHHHQLQQHQLHQHQQNHHHHLAGGDHLGDELALGNEHPFMTTQHPFSAQEHSASGGSDHHQWDAEQNH